MIQVLKVYYWKIKLLTFKKITALMYIVVIFLVLWSCEKQDENHSLVGVWENFEEFSDGDLIQSSNTNTLEYKPNGQFALKSESVTNKLGELTEKIITITEYSGTYSVKNDTVTEVHRKKVVTRNSEVVIEIESEANPVIIKQTFKIENDQLTLKRAEVENVIDSGKILYRK